MASSHIRRLFRRRMDLRIRIRTAYALGHPRAPRRKNTPALSVHRQYIITTGDCQSSCHNWSLYAVFSVAHFRRKDMKCSKCGTEYEGNFCPKCGTAADPNCNVCPKCGQARTDNDRFCKNCGYDYQNHQANRTGNIGTSAVAAIKRVPKKIWITIGAIIVAAAILLAILIPTISFLTNKFRVAFVDQIKIGDSRERVLELLGEPYEYDENSTTYEYYSDNYLALLEENDSFDPDSVQDWNDLESAFEDALELEQKLQTEEYAYIAITFDSSRSPKIDDGHFAERSCPISTKSQANIPMSM